MLNSRGFDLWADGYDKSVSLSEEADEYPFAGYKKVLGTIYSVIRSGSGKRILDVGFGTGILSKKLYDEGYLIYGVDFSKKMIDLSKEKMPDATLIQYDFSQGLPICLRGETFDAIVCTYAIHHLSDSQKIKFIRELLACLSAGGKVLIGDVAFPTVKELEQCRARSGDRWDEDERYPVAEVLRLSFPAMRFEKISDCAGVLSFAK